MPPTDAPVTDADLTVSAAARELDRILQEYRGRTAAVDARLTPWIDLLVDFTGRGKWLRPRFLLAGFRVVDAGPVPVQVLRAAGGLELLQSCALVHDDILDRSDTRRGAPSTHRAVTAAHLAAGLGGDADHLGTSVATLLGDLALAWADDLVSEAVRETGHPAAARVWRDVRTEVLAGQLLDLAVATHDESDPQQQFLDAMAVNRAKTAAYTVRRPVELGAALAGADEATLTALGEYGTHLGIAFQLRDDLLGLFGDPAVTGKPAGDDLVEGKRTVLLAWAREELATTGRLADFDATLAGSLTPALVDELLRTIAGTGAVDRVEAEIAELGNRAIEALEPLRAGTAPEHLAPLTALVDKAIARSR